MATIVLLASRSLEPPSVNINYGYLDDKDQSSQTFSDEWSK